MRKIIIKVCDWVFLQWTSFSPWVLLIIDFAEDEIDSVVEGEKRRLGKVAKTFDSIPFDKN